MAILKKEYELSVWDETLGEKGQKNEIKRAIIGAHDMTYPGRATSLKLSRKINGTNTLTFQLPSKFFDDISGDYIHNEFCDYLFNERKLKLKYDGEWFEFYIKSVSENKQFKSIMYQYSCEDAFIDELSRNGYGITFDTELYNNVEEIGVFTEQILEDSIWEYDASKNWGDFTEYSEEKLFKIPVSMFSSIKGHKLNYVVNGELTNVYTGEKRQLELGDDLSREQGIFWDNGSFDKGIQLLGELEDIKTDGYIYIPYSCLGFCYTTDIDGAAATEMAQSGTINNITSYYLAPQSIDPTSLIQFIAIPSESEIQIDEAGLLVNKDYSYVMTLQEWNSIVNTNLSYDIEKKIIKNNNGATCNKIVCYDGYLESINDIELTFGKKVSITDRTEINISEDIDQYVVVYNNKQNDYKDMFTSEDWIKGDNYRICSYERTRTIVPQLARNLVQNGTNIVDTSGWEVMKLGIDLNDVSSSISIRLDETISEEVSSQTRGLILSTNYEVSKDDSDYYRTFLNFGIVGQEEKIEKDQMYVLCIKGEWGSLNEDTGIWEESGTSSTDKLLVIIGNGDYDSNGDYELNGERIEFSLSNELNTNGRFNKYYFIRSSINIDNPYFCLQLNKDKYFNLTEASFFKAFTKGTDFFEDGYYKYSGRDIFFNKEKEDSSWKETNNIFYREANENEFIKETDVFSGDAYSYKKYFRQQIQYNEEGNVKAKDTFMLKSYLNNDIEKNALPPEQYTEDDYKIITDYIDLNKCKHYVYGAAANEKDCKYANSNGICMYQKYGYCPYLFETQKHCRKIRTLNGEKSNRFNLTQELSKVFEVYPVYYIEHFENGKIKTDKDGKMIKNIFYITEKGMENKIGFRYEKNLSNISRTLTSNEIVTKLYVEDVDSELSKTGLCSIKTAEDNPSKDSYIIDFSYYTMKGLLDEDMVKADLYGIGENDLGYLKQLGYYNGKYDEISNKIINLQDESFTELQANIEVNLTGIETAQQEMNKINKTLQKYAQPKNGGIQLEESDTYKSYKIKYEEQRNILLGLIESTFITDGYYYYIPTEDDSIDSPINKIGNAEEVLNMIKDHNGFKEFKKNYLDTFKYKNYGIMGQYTEEYSQIQKWKKERAKYLKDINRISLEFYQKYEPYLKEGTWSDSNYLSDNAYYFGAKEVAKQGAIPKVNYSISVVDLAILDSDYTFNIADTTYIEDIETFGINPKTGFPNRLKVIISGITYDLDIPSQNSIEIQNYTSQFEDLFQQVTASVQSLSFNENIYKRSSNFTATQNVSGESLQGGLSDNKLTLLETDEKNIELDYIGQRGSDINNHNNKYKLTGEGLYFSNNGGQTWNVGVTPKGINADYINVGTLDASKIQIVDGNYLYFLWDKSGITAYREPRATSSEKTYFSDFAKFNKYGLSLVEDGKIRLRAGYNYIGNSLDAAGDYNKEADLSAQNSIGFYLYNDNGQEIFKTESGNGDSARISLAGEIYVTQNLNEKIYTKYVYGYNDPNNPLELKSELFYKVIPYDQEDILNAVIYEGNITFKDYYLSNWRESTDVQYFSYTKAEEIIYFSVRTTELINKKIFYTDNNMDTYIDGQSLNFIITFLRLENNNFVPIEDTDGLFETLSIINENIFNITNETKTIDIKGNYGYPKEYKTLTSIPISTKDYYEKEVNKYVLKNTSAYVVQRNTYEFSLYNKIITSGSEEDISKEDGIAIFINNQAVNDPTSSNGYYKRLISCVKAGENSVDNILSVLSDGGLYLGGKVETQDNISTLKNLSDYIRINTEGENNEAIVVKDGTIKIGGEDLVQGIMDVLGTQIQEIRTIVEQAGLIEHSHDVSGIESYPKKTTPQISDVYSVGVSNEGSLHLTHNDYAYGANASRIVLYGGMLQSASEPIDGYFTVSIEDFFKGVQIALKEGSSTGTAGDVPGLSGGTMTSGYIVEGQ